MIKYCKFIDEAKGLVKLGAGCSDEYYQAIGMVERDVKQSDIDNKWYLTEKCPMKTEEEKEREERERISQLGMTKLDFVNSLESKGITYEALRVLLDNNYEAKKQFELCERIYRFNPLLEQLGYQFGLTPADLDEMFIEKGVS